MKPGGLKSETGSELLARLSSRPSLRGLEHRLFDKGPNEQQTVELCGCSASGKTLLLTQLVAKCILPRECDGIPVQGCGAAAVLINTDHHFRVRKLIQLMLGIVERACESGSIEYSEEAIRRRVVLPAVERLVVVNCYDNNEFKLTLETLDNILMNDPQIGLIAIDSISSFYWQDREIGGVWSIDQYLKNLLRIVQKHSFEYKIVAMYTKPRDFASKGQNNSVALTERPVAEKINYRINLVDSHCVVETAGGKREVRFKIDAGGLIWNTENHD